MKKNNRKRFIYILISLVFIMLFFGVINFVINIPNSYKTKRVNYNSNDSAIQIVQKFSIDHQINIIDSFRETDILLDANRYEYIEKPMFEDGFVIGESISYIVQTETCNYKFVIFISETELPYEVTHLTLSDNKRKYTFNNDLEINYEKFVSRQDKCTEYYYFEFQFNKNYYIGEVEISKEYMESNVCDDAFGFFENLIRTILL